MFHVPLQYLIPWHAGTTIIGKKGRADVFGYHDVLVWPSFSTIRPHYSCDVFRFFGFADVSSGGTNSFSLSLFFSSFLTFAFSALSASATLCFASLPRKYSPLSICKSTLLFSGAGGKGVYVFFVLSVILCGTLLLDSVLLLKFGRYRLQSSLARAGSLASSRLILFLGQRLSPIQHVKSLT